MFKIISFLFCIALACFTVLLLFAPLFELKSAAFTNTSLIPTQFTCDGDNVSPSLAWKRVPKGTKSYALIVTDPDVPDPNKPQGVWTHWVMYNISASIRQLPQRKRWALKSEHGVQGKNDWKVFGFSGPCPPVGKHRYFFTLYALDVEQLGVEQENANRLAVEKAMQGHILKQTTLMGRYQKSKL